jgi:hypothetical protein
MLPLANGVVAVDWRRVQNTDRSRSALYKAGCAQAGRRRVRSLECHCMMDDGDEKGL